MAQDDSSAHSPSGDSRALVALDSTVSQPRNLSLPDAGFLVQIIASAGHMGDFRRHRRAEPALAMASYRSAALLTS